MTTRKDRMTPPVTVKTTIRWHASQRERVLKIIKKLQNAGRMDITTAFHEAMELWIKQH